MAGKGLAEAMGKCGRVTDGKLELPYNAVNEAGHLNNTKNSSRRNRRLKGCLCHMVTLCDTALSAVAPSYEIP